MADLILLVMRENKGKGKLLAFEGEVTLAGLKEAIEGKCGMDVKPPLQLYHKDNNSSTFIYSELNNDEDLNKVISKEKGRVIRLRVGTQRKPSPVKQVQTKERMSGRLLTSSVEKPHFSFEEFEQKYSEMIRTAIEERTLQTN